MHLRMPPARKHELVVPSVDQAGFERFVDLEPIFSLQINCVMPANYPLPFLEWAGQLEFILLPGPAPRRPTPDLSVFGKEVRIGMTKRPRKETISRDAADGWITSKSFQHLRTKRKKRVARQAVVLKDYPLFLGHKEPCNGFTH